MILIVIFNFFFKEIYAASNVFGGQLTFLKFYKIFKTFLYFIWDIIYYMYDNTDFCTQYTIIYVLF